MNIKELIERLNKIEDKDREVCVFCEGDYININEIEDRDLYIELILYD